MTSVDADSTLNAAHDRGLLLAMSGSVAMVFLDQTVVGLALQAMRRDLALDATSVEWVVTAYLLAFGCLVSVGGYVGDRIGQRRTFLTGVGLFTLASVWTGLSPSALPLIVGRALQGVGAALMQPASLALITSAFPRERRGAALSVYYNVASAALVLGPPLGGFVAQYLGWRWVFLLNVPLALATVVAAVRWCPREVGMPPAAFDRMGAIVLIVGVASLVVGLQQGPEWGWRAVATLVCLGAGVTAMGLLGVVEGHLAGAHPILDLELLSDRMFSADLLTVFVTRMTLVGMTIFLAIWLQASAALSASAAGLVILPGLVVMIWATAVGGRMLDRRGPRQVNVRGLTVMAAGHVAAAVGLLRGSWPGAMPGLILIGMGTGLATAANSDAVSRAATIARSGAGRAAQGVGAAAGLVQTLRQIGGAMGVPLVGVMVARSELGTAFLVLGGVLGVTALLVTRMQAPS